MQPSPEANPSKSISKKNKVIILILALLVLCFVCSSTTLAFFYFVERSEKGNSDPVKKQDRTSYDLSSDTLELMYYYGYEEFEIPVYDYTSYNESIFAITDGFESLFINDVYAYEALHNEDPEAFYEAYYALNNDIFNIASHTYSLGTAEDTYPTDEEPQGLMKLFSSKVYAKERHTWLYYIPVYGTLLKQKHQTIEQQRSQMYQYLTQDMDPIARNELIEEFGLGTAEGLREAPDSTIATLASSSELRAGINWGELATGWGEAGVNAYVDGIKSATSGDLPNPFKDTANNAWTDIRDGKIDTVNDKMPKITKNRSGDKRAALMVRSDVMNTIDEIVGDQEIGRVEDLDDKINALATELLDKYSGQAMITTASTDTTDPDLLVPLLPGIGWNGVAVTEYTVPVEVSDIYVEEGETLIVQKPTLPLFEGAITASLSEQLGFMVVTEISSGNSDNPGSNSNDTPDTGAGELSVCMDTTLANEEDDNYKIEGCRYVYTECLRSPIETKEGYYSCIGAGGGCFDIGKSAYVYEDDCADYENEFDPDDFQYEGNVRYCECVRSCQAEYKVQKDCESILENCCQNASL